MPPLPRFVGGHPKRRDRVRRTWTGLSDEHEPLFGLRRTRGANESSASCIARSCLTSKLTSSRLTSAGQDRSFHAAAEFGMNHTLENLFANVRKQNPFRPAVRSVALLGMRGDDQPWYMQVRFYDFATMDIEGDHLMFSLQEAINHAQADYGILESDWRPLQPGEVDSIPSFIAGERIQRKGF